MKRDLPTYEALSLRERKYCVEMMLSEINRKEWNGDTRIYLSLDMNDEAVVRALLTRELSALVSEAA